MMPHGHVVACVNPHGLAYSLAHGWWCDLLSFELLTNVMENAHGWVHGRMTALASFWQLKILKNPQEVAHTPM